MPMQEINSVSCIKVYGAITKAAMKSPEFVKNMGSFKNMAKKDLREIVRKSNEAKKSLANKGLLHAYGSCLRCGDCNKEDCAKRGERPTSYCYYQKEFIKRWKKSPISAFEFLGLHDPNNFARMMVDDMYELKDCLNPKKRPKLFLEYLQTMLQLGKLLYGDKHTIMGTLKQEHEIKILSIEKILVETRKQVEYDPTKKIAMKKPLVLKAPTDENKKEEAEEASEEAEDKNADKDTEQQ